MHLIEAINSCVTGSNLKLLKEYDDEFKVFDAKEKWWKEIKQSNRNFELIKNAKLKIKNFGIS